MTAMAIVGWLFLCMLLGFLSLAWGVVAVFSLGRYNIGGVPNSLKKKVLVVVLGVALCWAWWFVAFHNAPFTVTLK